MPVQDAVRRAIAGLPPLQREVILLKYHHGYRNDEIASLLDTTEDAVRRNIARGKARLAELLRKEGIEV